MQINLNMLLSPPPLSVATTSFKGSPVAHPSPRNQRRVNKCGDGLCQADFSKVRSLNSFRKGVANHQMIIFVSTVLSSYSDTL